MQYCKIGSNVLKTGIQSTQLWLLISYQPTEKSLKNHGSKYCAIKLYWASGFFDILAIYIFGGTPILDLYIWLKKVFSGPSFSQTWPWPLSHAFFIYPNDPIFGQIIQNKNEIVAKIRALIFFFFHRGGSLSPSCENSIIIIKIGVK